LMEIEFPVGMKTPFAAFPKAAADTIEPATPWTTMPFCPLPTALDDLNDALSPTTRMPCPPFPLLSTS
jgi:hypothetical protein